MGHWCTLHLFDDKKFYEELIPEMKGRAGNIESVCREFLKCYTIGGMQNYSTLEINKRVNEVVTRIHEISNSIEDKSFKTHTEFSEINDFDESMEYLGKLNGHYEFCRFLEYSIFKCCADFFPHIPLGKGGLSRNLILNSESLAFSILNELDMWNSFFCVDMMGITNWLNSEEVHLLYLDKANLIYNKNEKGESIYNLIEIANNNKMGLIVGSDMREEILERLPANKLITLNEWEKLNTEGMLFEI